MGRERFKALLAAHRRVSMSVKVSQQGPGYYVDADAGDVARVDAALQQIGAKVRKQMRPDGGAAYACNGSGQRAADALGVPLQ